MSPIARETTEYPDPGAWPVEVPWRHHFVRGVVIGLVLLLVVSALKTACQGMIGSSSPFLMYFAPVLVAAWYGGRDAGLVTTAGAALSGTLLFVEPRPWVAVGPAVVQTTLFVVEGAMIVFVTARLSVERRRAVESGARAYEVSRRLEAILGAVDEGITLQDPTGRLVYANEQAARLLGLGSPAEAVAIGAVGFERVELHDQHGEPVAFQDLPGARALRGEPAGEVLIQLQYAASPVRWAVLRAATIRDERGRPAYALNVFRDVTARRLHEESIRLGQRWLSTALSSVGDAVIASDADGRVVLLNPVAGELTGWSSVEAGGRPLTEVFRLLRERERVPVTDPLAEATEHGEQRPRMRPALLVHRDGTERPIEHTGTEIRDGQGRAVGAVYVFRDVSERRREEERQAFLSRCSAILASSVDYDRTLAAVAELAVPAMADWCGVDLLEGDELRRVAVAHVDPSKLRLLHELIERYPPGETSALLQVARTGQPLLMSTVEPAVLEAAARDPRHLEMLQELGLKAIIAVPMRRADEVIGVITFAMAESGRSQGPDDLRVAEALAERAAVAVDKAMQFADQVRAREQLEQARAEAEKANRLKDEFLAILGHELRNPLAPIFTALQLMKMHGSEELARERTVIERQARHLLRLVDDLLDVSRITRGSVRLAREPVDLADVVHRALQTVQPAIEERRLHLSVSVPRAVVAADEVRLAQVLTNLLSNATKYTDPGGHVEIRGERRGDRVALSVRDDGVGISREMLPRVFDLFAQEAQSLERAQGGLGLGLAIARRLVEQHGGTLTAHSDGPGKGSCFVLTLPTMDQPAPDEIDTGPIVKAGATRRILVVDDNDDARAMLVMALGAVGHEVLDASDGPQALAIADRTPPDLALLDIGLPVMDGYELARRLRDMPGLARTKLVALTGYGQESDRARSAEVGFDRHLVKPVSLDTLQDVIEELVG